MLRLFSDHPASVGESYSEHMGSAFSFGGHLIGAGIACLLHGIFPFLFVKTGSEAVSLLHDRMIVNRDKRARNTGSAAVPATR